MPDTPTPHLGQLGVFGDVALVVGGEQGAGGVLGITAEVGVPFQLQENGQVLPGVVDADRVRQEHRLGGILDQLLPCTTQGTEAALTLSYTLPWIQVTPIGGTLDCQK